MAKIVSYGSNCRRLMLSGIQKTAAAVGTTLGPRGRNVVIEQSYGAPKITKDGVTVAKAIDLPDKFENLGAQIVKQAASVTNDVAGDGTTTATLLAEAIFTEGLKALVSGSNPVEIKKGIDRAVKHVVASLASQSRPIKTPDEICQVATISANGDKDIGELIAKAMQKVGQYGVITAEDGKTLETELQIVEGMSIQKGFVSPYFMTNVKQQKAEFDDAFVLVSEKKLSSVHELLPTLQYVLRAGRPLLIVADDIDGDALTALILNKASGKLAVCAVKAPGFGDNKTDILHDLACYVGAKSISDDSGVTLSANAEEFDPKILGTVRKVTIDKDKTVFLKGAGDPAAVQARTELIKERIAQSDSDWDKEKLRERLAKLTGGIAQIKVGAGSELELGEKKDRVVDALNATRAAVAEGIVAGSGLALMYASVGLNQLLQDASLSSDQRHGVRIVQAAIRRPARKIIDNSGVEGALYIQQMLEKPSSTVGYDVVSGEFCDHFQRGIVDPLLVVKTALTNAASVSSVMLTTECAIVDAPKDEKTAKTDTGAGAGAGGFGGYDDF